ncbi:hypothetical protein EKD04_017445 [Chloroflexales bacterium ZM16-3]|nr:hypothetical protein [Chloroflexales bacterium ZM16-3]
MTSTLTAAPSLEVLRSFADLEPYFTQLDAGEPANWIVSGALFHESESELVIQFAVAVLSEVLGAELSDGEELSDLAIVEMLDPAKGFPAAETRHIAALLALSIPATSAKERRDNAYLASYLTDDPNIGLAVSINEMRAAQGLGPTGW